MKKALESFQATRFLKFHKGVFSMDREIFSKDEKDLLRKAFYELRNRGISVEEILEKMTFDTELHATHCRENLERLDIFTPFELARMEKEESMRKCTLKCIAIMIKEFEKYDRISGLIFMETEKRNLANLSIIELFNLEIKIAKIKDETINSFVKLNNIIPE